MPQGRHGIMKIESTAVMSNPKADPHTVLIHGQPLTEVKPTSGNIHIQDDEERIFLIIIIEGWTSHSFKELILVHLQMLVLELMLC